MSTSQIEFPEEYTLEQSQKKIKKKINRLSKKGLGKISEFIGTSFIEGMFYLYLLKKYRSPCFLTESNGDFWEILGINLKIREFYSVEESELINSYLERLAVKLVHCINNDVNIIIIPLGLTLYFPDGREAGHANVLIYRKKFNHIEHFEPHGKIGAFGNEKLNSSIDLFLKLFIDYVNMELFKKRPAKVKDFKFIELIEANQVCPYIRGFQTYEESSEIFKNLEIEGAGYCAAWSMFFTELCLKNPEMTSDKIIISIFQTALFKSNPADYFRHIIRGYATFINEKISTYFTFLLDKQLDIEDIKKMNIAEQTKLKDKLKIIMNIEMELAFNPNALDDKIRLLNSKIDNGQYLNSREQLKISKEVMTLEKYRERMNDFNSPINTPSSLISKSSTSSFFLPPFSTPSSSTSINLKKIKTKICPPGKMLNTKTNRCNKIKPVSIMKIIREEKKKLEEELSKKTKECPPGKILNLITGRCNKIKTKTIKIKKEIRDKKVLLNKPKECPPGKILNTKTNRCNKIKNKTIKIKNE
jgi:hypothetical protein